MINGILENIVRIYQQLEWFINFYLNIGPPLYVECLRQKYTTFYYYYVDGTIDCLNDFIEKTGIAPRPMEFLDYIKAEKAFGEDVEDIDVIFICLNCLAILIEEGSILFHADGRLYEA